MQKTAMLDANEFIDTILTLDANTYLRKLSLPKGKAKDAKNSK